MAFPSQKILFVFGTRPEVIKIAPVVRAFAGDRAFQTITCASGQHRQMLSQSVSAFRLKVSTNLDIMTAGQTLEGVTTAAIREVSRLLSRVRPDLVMVQGDTTTVMAASLTAFYRSIPVGHIEAGLRSFDFKNPFPEELNRIVADRIASLHFAPTVSAKRNLLREGFNAKSIFVTGNTVLDALHFITAHPRPFSDPTLRSLFSSRLPPLVSRYLLLTSHRRENFGKPLIEICRAVRRIVRENTGVSVVYPVHLNPNVQKTVQRELRGIDRVHLCPPLDYQDLVALMRRCYFILSDSGGIQEEASAFGKPVLVLRRKTERREAIEAGSSRLLGELTEDKIVREAERLLRNPAVYRRMARVRNPFGDGRAAGRILQATRKFFGLPHKLEEFRG